MRRTGARVLHAHNVNPSFGWRALAAAREAGARVVLHLHNYRLVCAQGLCFTRGADCTRCHGRNTLPGVRLELPRRLARRGRRLRAPGSRSGSGGCARRSTRSSCRARSRCARLRELGAPLGDRAHVVGSVQREIADALAAPRDGPSRARRGPADAREGLRRRDRRAPGAAGLPLVVAGDGPHAAELRARAAGADVRFTGVLGAAELAELRRGAGAAIVPSRFAEILPLAALEAMAAGLPLAAADAGGLGEAVPREGLYPPGDAAALAERLRALWRDEAAGERGLAVVRERYSPAAVGARSCGSCTRRVGCARGLAWRRRAHSGRSRESCGSRPSTRDAERSRLHRTQRR